MRQIESKQIPIPADGPLFYVGSLSESLSDGPRGVWIEHETLLEDPILASTTVNGFKFTFIVLNPYRDIPADSIMALLHRVTSRSAEDSDVRANDAAISIYAEGIECNDQIYDLIRQAMDTGVDPPELTAFANTIMETAFRLSERLYQTLRKEYLQYWLIHLNDSLSWWHVNYYAKDGERWHVIDVDDGARRAIAGGLPDHPHGHIVLRSLTKGDVIDFGSNPLETRKAFSFSEEMISTALVDLGRGRKRSAILHAVIALESSTNMCLSHILESRMLILGQEKIVNAIAKELSLSRLSMLVYMHSVHSEGNGISWPLIDELYNIRNQITHRGRRRLPDTDHLKPLLVEVLKFVGDLESFLASTAKPQS